MPLLWVKGKKVGHDTTDLIKGKSMKRKKCLQGDARCVPHNKILDPAEVRAEMESVMNSHNNKMPTGAQQIAKAMPYAHKDNWRRNDKQQLGRKGMKKK